MTLKELLGDDLPDMETIKAALIDGFTAGSASRRNPARSPRPRKRWRKQFFDEEIGSDEFVAEIDNPGGGSGEVLAGSHTAPGGTINAFVKLVSDAGVLQRVLITGDFFVTPPRVVFDLEAACRHAHRRRSILLSSDFFAETDIDMLSVAARGFSASISDALAKRGLLSMAPVQGDDAFVLASREARRR